MKNQDDGPEQAAELRQRAEEIARGKDAQSPENIEALSPEETRRALHELRVHQIELEMQNEELRRAQVELDGARARYFDLYDLAPVGYCTLSEKGLVLEANLTAATLLGVARGALINQPFSRFILFEDQDIYYLHRKQLFETGQPQACELRLVKRDGTAFWGQLAATTAQDEGGAPVSRVVMSDITERKRGEKALQESEKLYHSLFENMLNGFAYCRMWFEDGKPQDFTYLAVNDAFESQTGLRNVVGRKVSEVIPGIREADPQLFEIYGRVAMTGQPERIEVFVEALQMWFLISIYCPAPEHFMAVFDVITERKRAEAVLRRYEMLASHSRDIILFMDRTDGRFLEVNAAAVEAYGYSREELLALTIHDLRAAGTQDLTAAQMATADTEGILFEAVHQRRDSSTFPVEVSSRGATLDRRRTLISVVRDITERKQAEEQLHRQAEQLASANAALTDADRRKDEFLAMLAHELRNPLAPVRSAVEILRLAGPREPILMRQRDIIDRQVTHMACLLGDLLDVARITRGKIELKRQPLLLADVLAHAVETTAPLIESRGHTLHVSMPPGKLCVEGDIDRLAQVVGNLLVNSAKYTDEGGQIWLSAELEDGQAVVRVRDNGSGMAPELLPRIYDLFTQADRTLARSQGGLGIGLTMVRNLVQMHGGTVEARSAGPGQGSEFIVRLPALPEANLEPHQPAKMPAPAVEGGSRRILVVDDVVDTATSLAELLGLWGHEVQVAHDGLSALLLARVFHPEVVLLDIGLPGMDGYTAARHLRAEHDPAGMLIVALTGYGQMQDLESTCEAGFDHHLVKPVDLDVLRGLLDRAAV